ncbi:hypothetical protein PHYBLDRAFT_70243 [Phycomyces blakesleeanus NRRL 1555(-)]|uniref:Uncharacterized protein n=1 Tax=Phycomyces blakesleeanus (strain ATCC 8743b / DSM 1359 / FGSC 10004 / NBRC 33097 / NRRL 1555) TaxID=763407 RepID=A0A167JVE7_PHYB8|nr:hypothetical protein PHYBLDRAFT_70243 [Phycomyces blakesleeanus NRRL 1555(-)]OAD66767.1 hypothetical protein PHYBLDRAFT_70243 [Phycomyces blakesleeanus NRRL 1555(-)]|eukprot:XP_018284807.1 hypothetical protein PHYBLDRAFT_70243 [Phycomyces blakesleeanus NRRL 1555(-)]
MTSSHKSALGLPTKLASYQSDTVYLAMIATTLSQYEYVLICDKSNIRVSGSPHVVLIKLINKLLTIYEQDFQLPLSLPGLQHMTDFSAMTKGIKKFVVCQDCHKVYKESVPVLSHCDFVKLDVHSSCNCQLTKTSASGALVAKRSYLYQSVINTL